jgi:hypothetical protein
MIKIRDNMFETNSSSCDSFWNSDENKNIKNELYVKDCVVEIIITIMKNESGYSNYHILDDIKSYDEDISDCLIKKRIEDSYFDLDESVRSKIIDDNKLQIQINFEGKYGEQYIEIYYDYIGDEDYSLKKSDIIHYYFNSHIILKDYILECFNYKGVELNIMCQLLYEGDYKIIEHEDKHTYTTNSWQSERLEDKLFYDCFSEEFDIIVRLLPPLKDNQVRAETNYQSLIIPTDDEIYNITAVFTYQPSSITIKDIKTITEITHCSGDTNYHKIANCVKDQLKNIEKSININQDITFCGRTKINGKLIGINADKSIFGVQFSVPRSDFIKDDGYYEFDFNDTITLKDVDLTGYSHLRKWNNKTGKTTADIVQVKLKCMISQIIKINDIEQDII